jgi:hypothetical protein
MKKYNDSSFSHLILKNQNNLGKPLSIQSNLRTSGFTQPGPILKWVVIYSTQLFWSIQYGLDCGFSPTQPNSASLIPDIRWAIGQCEN